MIANGRRIDQRTTMAQQGGIAWFIRHLRLNGFDPVVFDGRDPAAFVWAIFEMERRLEAAAAAVRAGRARYPVRLPYGVAVAPKGAGFYGAGTNLAHNLPLGGPTRIPMRTAARHFNEHARRLRVARRPSSRAAAAPFQTHERSRPTARARSRAGDARRCRLARSARRRVSAPCRPIARTGRDGRRRHRWRRSIRASSRTVRANPASAAPSRQSGRDAEQPDAAARSTR